MKKILFIVRDVAGEHGWSSYTCNIIREAIRSGYSPEVAACESGVTDFSVEQHIVLEKPHASISNPIAICVEWFRLRRLIRSVKPDIIHIVTEPYVQIFALPLPAHIPVLMTIHGTYSRLPCTVRGVLKQKYTEYIFKKALRRITHIISVSGRTKKIFEKYIHSLGISCSPVTVIPPAISISRELSTQLPGSSKDDAFHVLTVGAVKYRKGVHEAIPLLSEWARNRHKKIVYDVVGMFDKSSEYGEHVYNLALTSEHSYFETKFHGHVNDDMKLSMYKNASCYMHLERVTESDIEVEGFGVGSIDAASYGVPAIVASGSATAEGVSHGVSGYVIDLSDPDTMFDALDNIFIKKVLKQEEIRKFTDSFAPEKRFIEIELLYKKYL